MNPIVSGQLREFSETNAVTGFEEQDYFEVYAIHSISNGLLRQNTIALDSHLSGSEFGIDGVSVLVQGDLCLNSDDVAVSIGDSARIEAEFHFYQAKRGEHHDYGDISKFFDGVFGFFDTGMENESTQLDDLIAAKNSVYEHSAKLKKNPTLRCFYTTTGAYQQVNRIEKLLEAQRARLLDLNLFDDIEITLIGAKELQDSYRQVTNLNAVTFVCDKLMTMPSHEAVVQSYTGYIKANELLKLVVSNPEDVIGSDINRTVFFDNVRDYNPSSDINQSIIEDINRGDSASFVFKNNGVTVVARSISRTGDDFTLEQFQIVNGCQTCNVLYECREQVADISVPIRLVGSTDDDFTSSIIIGTNKQNEVKAEQFWAFRSFMKDLEEYCRNQPDERRIYLERRENQYRNENVEKTRVLKTRDLLKVVAAMHLHQPNRSARDYRRVKKEYENEIFQNEHQVLPYYLACLAAYRFDFMARNNRFDKSWKIYKYFIIYVIGKISFDGSSVLSAVPRTTSAACSSVQNLLMDEDRFVNHITQISNILDGLVLNRNLNTREQIRDAMRSDAFANQFYEEVEGYVLD